jgi:putative (di)nucleoside polyphosphate hydrolase
VAHVDTWAGGGSPRVDIAPARPYTRGGHHNTNAPRRRHNQRRPMPKDLRPYRKNVGALLRRADGLLLMAERVHQADSWQLPQGGVDDGEDLEAALWRELSEELGMEDPRSLCEIVGQGPATTYDFPLHLTSKVTRRYRGQEQTLFVLDFKGTEADLDLEAHDPPEFQAVRWVTPDEAIVLLWEVKRPILVATFRHLRHLFPDWSGVTE